MSVKELEDRVQALPARELKRFSRWFERYKRQALNNGDDEDLLQEILTEDQKSELLRRVEFAKAHPDLLQAWEGTTELIRRRLHALHDKKAARGRSRS